MAQTVAEPFVIAHHICYIIDKTVFAPGYFGIVQDPGAADVGLEFLERDVVIVPSEYFFRDVDSYDTPEGNRGSLGFRLMLRSRWYFYAGIFGVFCRSGKLGMRGKLDGNAQIAMSNINLRLVEKCGGRVHIAGLANLRRAAGKPTVVVANHMSLLETGLLHAVMREYLDFSFVVKKSLMDVPYFCEILKALDAIPVTRENPREDLKTMLREGKRILESGRSLIVFPQSTRSDTIDPEKFNSIGVKLAKSAGAQILPLALKTDFLANGRGILRDMGPVRPERRVCFEFAPPLTVSGNGQEEQHRIVEFIASRLNVWRGQDAEENRR